MLLRLLACEAGEAGEAPAEAADCVELPRWHADADGDGFGDPDRIASRCERPVGFVGNAADCDDADPERHPGAGEACDGIDQDCDGAIDDGALGGSTWYRDADGDGFGGSKETVSACEPPEGYAAVAGDCDDDDDGVNPAAAEICDNAVDDDCDGGSGNCANGGGSLGFADRTWRGLSPDREAGRMVAGGSDLTGDGVDDLLVGGYDSERGDAVWLIEGARPLHYDELHLKPAYYGEAEGDQAGSVAAFAGDVDGDGRADLLIGAPGNDVGGSEAGATYLMVGPEPRGGSLALALATFTGADGDRVGSSVSAVGDVDGDGFDEVAFAGIEAGEGAGAAWIRWGDVHTLGGDADGLATRLSGMNAGDALGTGLAGAGDVDGDGTDDVLVGGPGFGTGDAGAAWLVLGGRRDRGTIDEVAAARFDGADAGEGAGRAVDGAGDADADGYDDVLVAGSASVYVIRGAPAVSDRSLTAADGVLWPEEGSAVGTRLAGLGDLDGDGHADAIVGARQDSEFDAGGAWLIHGRNALPGGQLDEIAVRFSGVYSGSRAGEALDAAGDLDGDGRPDFVIGAPGVYGGFVYCVSGHGI